MSLSRKTFFVAIIASIYCLMVVAMIATNSTFLNLIGCSLLVNPVYWWIDSKVKD